MPTARENKSRQPLLWFRGDVVSAKMARGFVGADSATAQSGGSGGGNKHY
jgi:hypothetical protein